MRLTTLARKVGRTPSQLISFLQGQQIDLPNGANTKLDDDTITMVLREYPIEEKIATKKPEQTPATENIFPEVITEPVPVVNEAITTVSEVQVAQQSEVDIIPEVEEPIPVAAAAEESSSARKGTIDDLESDPTAEIDLITAKKVKLEGIKVLGKIELPEKQKKKVEEADGATEPIEETPQPERKVIPKKPEYRKPVRHQKHERQPLSYEERQKREQQAREKEIQKKVEEDKKRKQRYYETKLAPKITANPSKKKTEKRPPEQVKAAPVVLHKNPLKRFWSWINGKYDRF